MMSSKTFSDLFAEREKLIFAGIAPSDQSRTITGHDFYRVRVQTNRVATLTAFSNQSHPPPSNSAIKRLQSELKDLTMSDSDSDSGISAFPEKDTIMCWKGRITGGQGSVFGGKQYKLSLNFPNDYPFKPPFVKFDYPIPFHPNVDVYVKIYLDILLQDESNKWSSAYDVRTVLLSIKSLLDDPNLTHLSTTRQLHFGAIRKRRELLIDLEGNYGRWVQNFRWFKAAFFLCEKKSCKGMINVHYSVV